MATIEKTSDIITGDIFRKVLEISINDVPLAPDAEVKVVLTSVDKKTIYTPVIEGIYVSALDGWVVELSKTQTKIFLRNPNDALSSLVTNRCYLEAQISTPYNITLHWMLSISKGLID